MDSIVDLELAKVESYTTRDYKQNDRLAREYRSELCLQHLAQRKNLTTTFSFKARYNDHELCKTGIWSHACNSKVKPGRTEQSKSTGATSTCKQKLPLERGVLFVMLISDASVKGFLGVDTLKPIWTYLLQRKENFIMLHIDGNASEKFVHHVKGVLGALSAAQRSRIQTTQVRLQTPWGSSGLVLAELVAVAEALKLQPLWSWDWMLNLSESDMPIRTMTELSKWLAQIPCGHTLLAGRHGILVEPRTIHVEVPHVKYPGSVRLKPTEALDGQAESSSTISRGSQWHMLSREFAKAVIVSVTAAELFDRKMRYVWVADEVSFCKEKSGHNQ